MAEIIYYKNNKTKTASQILKHIVNAIEVDKYGTDLSISFKFYDDLKYGDGGKVAKLLEELLEEKYKNEFFVTFNPYVDSDGYSLHIEWKWQEEPDEKEPIEEYEMFLRDLFEGRLEEPTNIEFEESDDDEYNY